MEKEIKSKSIGRSLYRVNEEIYTASNHLAAIKKYIKNHERIKNENIKHNDKR